MTTEWSQASSLCNQGHTGPWVSLIRYTTWEHKGQGSRNTINSAVKNESNLLNPDSQSFSATDERYFYQIKAVWYKLKEKNGFRNNVLNIEHNMVVHAPILTLQRQRKQDFELRASLATTYLKTTEQNPNKPLKTNPNDNNREIITRMNSQILSEYCHLGASIDAIIQSIPGSSVLRDCLASFIKKALFNEKMLLEVSRALGTASHLHPAKAVTLFCPKSGIHSSQRNQ